jgi:hypothetical protein
MKNLAALVPALLLCSNVLATTQSTLIERISCNDYGDYYVGEACALHFDQLNSTVGKAVVLVDLFDFYAKYNFSSHGDWSKLPATVNMAKLVPCDRGHYIELEMDPAQSKCFVARNSDISVKF